MTAWGSPPALPRPFKFVVALVIITAIALVALYALIALALAATGDKDFPTPLPASGSLGIAPLIGLAVALVAVQ